MQWHGRPPLSKSTKDKQGGDIGEKLGHMKFCKGMAGFKSLGMTKRFCNLPKWTMLAGWVVELKKWLGY
jgi:hypothetical protein